MQLELSTVLMFAALGCAAGFLGGLIGIGGGFILVPGLFYVFVRTGLAPDQELPLVLGTTMAGILFTAAGAVRAHAANGVVRFDVVRRFAPWVAAGAVAGAILATRLDAGLVKAGFAAFCLYSSARMLFFPGRPCATAAPAPPQRLALPGVFFGSVCGLIGVGGANLFVPFLLKRSLDMRHAMATASALQLPIASIGSAAYIGLGLMEATPRGAFGFVYLPALLVVAVSSVACAPMGARMANTLPVSLLKKIFGVVAALVGLKMAGAFSVAAAWAGA
jgi:uncharacterized membrane protein YfcA